MSRINSQRAGLLAAAWLVPIAFAAAAHPDPQAEPPPIALPPGAQTSAETQTRPIEDAPPNLILVVEGNRRWCARTLEPTWPATQQPRVPAAARRRRTPPISTIAYAHYVIAYPESPAGAEPQQTAAEATPPAGAEAAAVGEGAPPAQDPATEAAAPAATQAEAPQEDAGGEERALSEEEIGQLSSSPIDPDLVKRPGAVVISQSIVYQTMTPRRVEQRGQPLKVQMFWDNSRACCTFPSKIEARLPEGRYTLQVHFDVLMRRKGWQHVQVARITGVEVKEGAPTEIPLRIDQQGYVQVRPQGRVVEFPTAAEAPTALPPTPPEAPGAAPGEPR
jgi:hypothetical protein